MRFLLIRLRAAMVLLLAMLGTSGLLSISPAWAQASPSARYPDFADVVEQISPAVVNIRTTEKIRAPSAAGEENDTDNPFAELFRQFGLPIPNFPRQQTPRQSRPSPQPEQERPRGVGSGFLISSDGLVMTNAHVVEGASEVLVTLTDKREFKAKIVGTDTRTDIALVKIEGRNLPSPVRVGDVSRLRVGEWVLAIGSPFGLENSVSAGIVSAKQRDTGDYLPFIQSDTAINPGNSGGPLVNVRGEVVGVNSQIYSRSGGSMGISFSIPIDEAMRVAEQLRTTGKVDRGRIGVRIAPVSREIAESMGLARESGALVQMVENNSPAEKAGVQVGDIITRVNGVAVEKSSDLPRMVGAIKPGTRASLTIFRRGSVRELSVTIGELVAETAANPSPSRSPPTAENTSGFGLQVQNLGEEQKRRMRLTTGVLVVQSSGAGASAGIRPGDIVLSLDNTEIRNVRDFETVAAKADKTRTINVLVRRGEEAQFLLLRPVSR